MKIGILTGGGDCPGLNAVMRAVTKTALIHYDAQVIGFLDGFRGLVDNDWVPLDYEAVSNILNVAVPFSETPIENVFSPDGRTGHPVPAKWEIEPLMPDVPSRSMNSIGSSVSVATEPFGSHNTSPNMPAFQ